MVAGTCRKGVKEGRMGEWQEGREGGRETKKMNKIKRMKM